MTVNSTLPAAGYVATALDSTQNYIVNSPGRAILLAVVYSPLIAIVLNVLRQLVCTQGSWEIKLTRLQIIPRDPSLPPEVFHIIPIFGSAIQYGNDPLNFFAKCKEKVRCNIVSLGFVQTCCP